MTSPAPAERAPHEADHMGREVFNEIAWRDFIVFAWSQDDAHAAFRGATGRPQRRTTGTGLDAMIDKACGVDEASDEYVDEFVKWATLNHWGEEFAPAKMKAALA